jgi:hypothetical protein
VAEFAGEGQGWPPGHQILWEGHREEEKKVGRFTRGSNGREERRERRSRRRLRRADGAPAAVAPAQVEKGGGVTRGVEEVPLVLYTA